MWLSRYTCHINMIVKMVPCMWLHASCKNYNAHIHKHASHMFRDKAGNTAASQGKAATALPNRVPLAKMHASSMKHSDPPETWWFGPLGEALWLLKSEMVYKQGTVLIFPKTHSGQDLQYQKAITKRDHRPTPSFIQTILVNVHKLVRIPFLHYYYYYYMLLRHKSGMDQCWLGCLGQGVWCLKTRNTQWPQVPSLMMCVSASCILNQCRVQSICILGSTANFWMLTCEPCAAYLNSL